MTCCLGKVRADCKEAASINPGVTYEFRLYADTGRARLVDTATVARLVDPGVGAESFGSLRRLIPVSRTFGSTRSAG